MCIFTALTAAGTAAAGTAATGTTAASIANALALIGTGVSAYGAYSQGQAQQQVANYNADVAKQTATAKRQEAAYEIGMQRENRQRLVARQRAGGVSAGLDISQGTPVAVFGDTYKQTEMDILARKYSGDAQATAYLNDARQMKASGAAAKQGGLVSAGSTLLGGFSNYYRNQYRPLG